MKVLATLSIGYYNCDRKEEIEIPDEELEGLDEYKKEEIIGQYVDYWVNETISVGWTEID